MIKSLTANQNQFGDFKIQQRISETVYWTLNFQAITQNWLKI